MNSNDEKLLRYFENEMTPEEKKAFEAELNNNPDLQRKLNAFNNITNAFSEYKDIKTDERYFNTLIPRFNERKDNKKRSFIKEYLLKPVYLYSAISSAAVVIIIFIVLNSLNKPLPATIQSVAKEMQDSELTEQLKAYKEDYYTSETADITVPDSVFHNYYYDQIKQVPGEVTQYVTSTSGYTATDNSLYKGMSDEEADKIYNELIHKKIL